MKRRHIILAPEARADLVEIEEWLAETASTRTTEAFITRILAFCQSLETASERGHRRDDVRSNMRIVGFERRMTIAFAVHVDRVTILRIFRAGRDWESELSED